MSIGLLLWKGTADAGLDDEREYQTWHDKPSPGEVLFMAGLCAIVAGGPIGAVEGAGIQERRTDAYVVAGVGEFVLGGLTYGLTTRLDANSTGRLLGLGIGAVIGAAGGAALIALEKESGAVSYREGTWRVSAPDIGVRPQFASSRFPSINVTLVSVRL